jgi:outer membrane protein assembly factor BamB
VNRQIVFGIVVAVIASGCGSANQAPSAAPTTTSVTTLAQRKSGVPQWGSAVHDAQRTGLTMAVGPQTGKVRWKRKLEGVVTPGPVVAADGTVYAASNGGKLHALDPKTGNDIWVFDGGGGYGNDLSSSPSILNSGTIVWPGPGGRLFLISASGKKLGSYNLNGFVLSPAIDEAHGLLYVQDMSATLWAWNVVGDQLTPRWSLDLGGSSYSSVAIAPDGTLRTGAGSDAISVRDNGTSGEVLWRYKTEDIIEVSPAVGADGTMVIGSNDPFEYAIDADGTLRWKFRKDSQTYGSPAVTPDGRAVFGDHTGRLHVVDLASGRETATAVGELKQGPSRSAGIWTSPVIDRNGSLYFGTRLGHIYGFNAMGALLFDIFIDETVDSYPALAFDGLLVIGGSDGYLYGIADS